MEKKKRRGKRIIDELRRIKVACVLPTYNNRDQLYINLEHYVSNSTIPSVVYVVEDFNDDTPRVSEDRLSRIFRGTIHSFKLLPKGPPIGVGAVRGFGVDYVIKNTRHKYIINAEDDCKIHKDAIERLLAVPYQNERFGFVGTSGNYGRFWRSHWTDESIKFYCNLGCLSLFTRGFIKKVGNFDPELRVREDVDIGLRAWVHGFYSAAVHAPITHKRHAIKEKKTSELPGGDAWTEANTRIKSKFGPMIKVTKNGMIKLNKNIFDYPDDKYILTKQHELRRIL